MRLDQKLPYATGRFSLDTGGVVVWLMVTNWNGPLTPIDRVAFLVFKCDEALLKSPCFHFFIKQAPFAQEGLDSQSLLDSFLGDAGDMGVHLFSGRCAHLRSRSMRDDVPEIQRRKQDDNLSEGS